MPIFSITPDNNITAYPSAAEAHSNPVAEYFGSAEELVRLVHDWPASRLVEIWNTLPGQRPVKKFTDQKTAVRRLWAALQGLLPEAGAQTAPEATAPVARDVRATARAKSAAARHSTKAAQVLRWPTQHPRAALNDVPSATGLPAPSAQTLPEPTPPVLPDHGATVPAKPTLARQGSKITQILNLLKQPSGATLKEVMSATGWQAHSVRGFISGVLGKKMGIAVQSAKRPDGERVYSVTQP